MTIYGNPIQGQGVVGAQLAPAFGVQNAGGAPANVAINPPTNMPLSEAMSRCVMPRNANVSSVNGVSTGAQNPTPIADLCTNGAGNQVNGGVAVAGVAGNPTSNGANDQQVFVSGDWTTPAGLSTGPTPTNTETLTSCPVSVNTTCGNVGLTANSFQG
jgi:hypothetical protein